MRFVLISGEEVEVSDEKVASIVRSGKLLANPYWRYSNLLTEEEVMLYLKRKADSETLKKIAEYIVVFAENLILTNYLYSLAENSKVGENYLKIQLPLLKELRSSLQSLDMAWCVKIEETVNEMLSKCRDYGIDPL